MGVELILEEEKNDTKKRANEHDRDKYVENI